MVVLDANVAELEPCDGRRPRPCLAPRLRRAMSCLASCPIRRCPRGARAPASALSPARPVSESALDLAAIDLAPTKLEVPPFDRRSTGNRLPGATSAQ